MWRTPESSNRGQAKPEDQPRQCKPRRLPLSGEYECAAFCRSDNLPQRQVQTNCCVMDGLPPRQGKRTVRLDGEKELQHLTRRELIEMAALGAVAAATMQAADDPPFTLPKLPYAYDALEPHIDAQTMQIHHDKHHQTYVDNLNRAVAGDATLSKMPVEQLLQKLDTLPAALKTQVRNQGGGHANHSLFWQTLTPAARSGKPSARLTAAIEKSFGSRDKFDAGLQAAATGVFGSGWAWLSLDAANNLVLDTAPNQDSPLLTGKKPLLGIDVWEHAYYLKYQNRRADYLKAIMNVINWDFVSNRYEELTKQG